MFHYVTDIYCSMKQVYVVPSVPSTQYNSEHLVHIKLVQLSVRNQKTERDFEDKKTINPSFAARCRLALSD